MILSETPAPSVGKHKQFVAMGQIVVPFSMFLKNILTCHFETKVEPLPRLKSRSKDETITKIEE
jgi:hypothetical protein